MSLPITHEIRAGLFLHDEARETEDLISVRHAAMILAPRRFLRIAKKIIARNMMMNADFSAAQAREIFFRPIRAGAVLAICFLMVDALHLEMAVQAVP